MAISLCFHPPVYMETQLVCDTIVLKCVGIFSFVHSGAAISDSVHNYFVSYLYLMAERTSSVTLMLHQHAEQQKSNPSSLLL